MYPKTDMGVYSGATLRNRSEYLWIE